MTIQEAKANLGQPFKLLFITSGLAARFDTIRYVENGIIYGDFIEAPAEDCRLKQEQPEHLKTKNDVTKTI